MSTQRLSFPNNLSRPQRVGRGQREGVITPGLQNHLDKRQKDIQKATKAAETRRKNGTTTGRKVAAGAAPTAPTTTLSTAADQNRPPQTPLSAVPTRIRSQLETTSPDLPRQPLLSMTSQPSSPFSFNQVQSAAPARSLPSMVPQDYQPVYPDFSQRGNADCSGSEQSRTLLLTRQVVGKTLSTMPTLIWMADDGLDRGHSPTDDDPPVEMHDVDVRKKHQKRKRVPQADQDSDVDDSPSRSLEAFESSLGIVVKALAIENPWPVASESGDPSADNDEFQLLIEDAWTEAIYFLELDPEDFDEISLDESNLIRSRISQFRGCVMGEADKLVGAGYGFIDIQSLDDPTPKTLRRCKKPIASSSLTRREVYVPGEYYLNLWRQLDDLLQDPKDTADIATVGRHPVFQKLLNAAFFAPKGQNHRAFYFTGHDFLPPATLGFLMTAIVCSIDKYKTGRHEIVAFDSETYRPVYQASMQFIGKWIDEYTKDVYPVNLAEERLRECSAKRGNYRRRLQAGPKPALNVSHGHILLA
ncbi:hypothetical protein B0H13DRAFT_2551366 [Mycena leptocephala]|nr:hypothetical protein B0H13DRAFT_2551366 [Mycena leptocephala]